MLVLITYDVNTADAAGFAGVCAKLPSQCVNYGQRVQCSVFECLLDSAQCANCCRQAASIIDQEKTVCAFYYLGKQYENKIEHFGCKSSYLPEEPS